MKLYSTLSGKTEEFKPIKKNEVGIYYCGMTLQEAPHVGHIRAALTSDILHRYLIYKGYKVNLIVNFTDIDDKVIVKAKEEGRDYREVAARFEEEYLNAVEKMNIKEPSFYPRATQHIEEIIEMVEKLIDRGYGYEKDGNVFYRVRKFKDYGKLSGKKVEDLSSGARVAVDEKKEDPLDFTLWKAAKKGEPFWYSPWGKGRPGWHIECSAMATHYLGDTIDVHGGGSDLIFPHHENEIAQSEGATGEKFANYWVHNEMLNIKREKMSKSLNNFIPINELMESYDPNVIRLYLLQAHYRKQLNYNRDTLKHASSGWERIKTFMQKTENLEGMTMGKYLDEFENRMDDDLDTPGAIALVFEIIHRANEEDSERAGSYRRTIKIILDNLGFKYERKKGMEVEKLMEKILKVRGELRENGEFEIADRIREVLKEADIVIEDKENRTEWRMK